MNSYEIGHYFESEVVDAIMSSVCPDLLFKNILYANTRNYPIFEQDIVILKNSRVLLVECKCHTTDRYITDKLFDKVRRKTILFNKIANVKASSVIVMPYDITTFGCVLSIRDIDKLNKILDKIPPNKSLEQLVRTVSTSRQLELTKLKGGHV